MASRSRELSVFFSSSAASSILCDSSSWATYSSHRAVNMALRVANVAASSFNVLSSFRNFCIVSVTTSFSFSYLLFKLASATSAVCFSWTSVGRLSGLAGADFSKDLSKLVLNDLTKSIIFLHLSLSFDSGSYKAVCAAASSPSLLFLFTTWPNWSSCLKNWSTYKLISSSSLWCSSRLRPSMCHLRCSAMATKILLDVSSVVFGASKLGSFLCMWFMLDKAELMSDLRSASWLSRPSLCLFMSSIFFSRISISVTDCISDKKLCLVFMGSMLMGSESEFSSSSISSS
ncbi:hypothetical protein BpHYR1_011494 [Brachionus plicatilis]|uniref:Uncharacterized protein n=1 Tax=Brachionus plicatilis TaxID=10195 RepID=A0A3M7S4G1_BRAPC|nr:hypothetical protein BpHYR1_011494 [Brachionus plicatilis]